jgi:hypothetical protein
MHYRFSVLAARLLADADAFRRDFPHPLLVWTVESNTRTWQLQWMTDRGTGEGRPTARDPLVLEVKKGVDPSNGFAMGVTVGRTANNDVVIDDPTVSRFHAWFRRDLATNTWSLADAESHNGTLIGLVRLAPNRPVPLFERAEVRVGDVPMTFFAPAAFEQHVRSMRRPTPAQHVLAARPLP